MLLSGVDTRHRFVGINESVMYHIAPRFSSSGVHRTDSQRARQSSALERPRATERRYDDYRGPEASDLSYTFRICSFVLSREAFDCIFHLGVLVFFLISSCACFYCYTSSYLLVSYGCVCVCAARCWFHFAHERARMQDFRHVLLGLPRKLSQC